MSNGFLDRSKLVQVKNFHPIEPWASGLALPEVAHQWNLMADACERETGYRLDASEGYRDYPTQVHVKAVKTAEGRPQDAATPGTSGHGDAKAIDAGSGAGYDGSVVETWLEHNLAKFGFSRPFSWELWHLLYVGNPTITQEEEDMSPEERNTLNNLASDVKAIKTELFGKSENGQTRLQETVILLRSLTTGNSRLKDTLLGVRELLKRKG